MSGECGEGTVRYGNTCVAIDPFDRTPPQVAVDPPLHTREVGIVRLTADEPATIFYTIDGSEPTTESPNEPEQVLLSGVPEDAQLRYFAIDLAGNRSDEQSRLWIIDRDGPSPPVDFKLRLTGSNREVTWTAPPDPRFGGVLVARVEGRLGTPPAGGARYAVGDQLSPGVTVVNISTSPGPGTLAFSESIAPRPGIVRYVAWAFDDLHNYGPPTGDYVLVPIQPQLGTITVDASTGQVTTMVAPSHVALTGTSTLAGTTLSLKLTVRNDTSRVLFAPKLLVIGAQGGTWSDSDNTLDTYPFRAYGAVLLPGVAVTRTLTFQSVASGTTLRLDLDLRDGQVMTASTWDDLSAGLVVDLATNHALLEVAAPVLGPGGDAATQRGGITPDGRLVVGARTSGTVSSFDLATGKRFLVATLRPQKSHVPQVILDRSGSTVYALVAEGHPRSINNNGAGAGSPTALVRLDAASLTETGRLPLDTSRNRDINLSPDGKLLLIATGVTSKGVIVIDLTRFEIKARILSGFRPSSATFSPNGVQIAVVGEQIALYNTADLVRTAEYVTPGSTSKVVRATYSDPNTLWIGRRSDTAVIDLRTGTSTPYPTLAGRMLEVYDGKIYTGNFSQVHEVDNTGAILKTFDLGNLASHWLGLSPF